MRNQAPLDPWTSIHVGVGAVFGFAGASWPVALLAAVAYELAEQVIERTETGRRLFGTTAPESPANVAVDVAAFAVGYGAARAALRVLDG